MEKLKSLIIWLLIGGIMKFEDVRNFEIVINNLDRDVLKFNYLGVLIGVRWNVVFEIVKLMGWVLEE